MAKGALPRGQARHDGERTNRCIGSAVRRLLHSGGLRLGNGAWAQNREGCTLGHDVVADAGGQRGEGRLRENERVQALRSTVAIQQPLGEQGTQAAWMGRPRGRWDRDGRTHSYAAHGKAATLETREANYPWV